VNIHNSARFLPGPVRSERLEMARLVRGIAIVIDARAGQLNLPCRLLALSPRSGASRLRAFPNLNSHKARVDRYLLTENVHPVKR
jgi:hypothetical protein